MSVLDKIAFHQNRRDELPNQELARELAASKDRSGIQEIARNLWNNEKAIQSDCLKVLYEIGYLDPALIADYAGDFLRLLKSRNNRLVWGGMIALSSVADLKANEIFPHVAELIQAMQKGSVITMDNGIKVLALVASQKENYCQAIFPYLLNHLESCRAKEVPQHAEKSLPAVSASNKSDFIRVLERRLADMTTSQAARLKKIIKASGTR
jgi:hypothetical protein